MRTMTNAQMHWAITRGFAWFERDAEGNQYDDWYCPIWTKAGGWLWNPDRQLYELLIV